LGDDAEENLITLCSACHGVRMFALENRKLLPENEVFE
jgi:hypothetical protein